MIEQLSVYTENKKGASRKILSIFSRENINVLGFIGSDSGEFGTLRMILSDTPKGFSLLTENGYLARIDEVIGLELADSPGALEKVMKDIEEMNINVDYMYVGYSRKAKTPLIILHCEEMDLVNDALKRKGYIIHPVQ